MNFSGGSKARCRAKVLLRGRKNMWLGHPTEYTDVLAAIEPASTTSHSATTILPHRNQKFEKSAILGKPHCFSLKAKINIFLNVE